MRLRLAVKSTLEMSLVLGNVHPVFFCVVLVKA